MPTDEENRMPDIDPAADPRCARPAELDRLLADHGRVLAAVEACHPWRLDDWRERLADAVTVGGDIKPEAEEPAERISGMLEVQAAAARVCSALDGTFGCGGIDSAGDDFPICLRA
jgi:hypothetical protein